MHLIDGKSILVWAVAWWWPCIKPLPEPMMTKWFDAYMSYQASVIWFIVNIMYLHVFYHYDLDCENMIIHIWINVIISELLVMFIISVNYSQVPFQRGPIYHDITYSVGTTVAESESHLGTTTDTP